VVTRRMFLYLAMLAFSVRLFGQSQQKSLSAPGVITDECQSTFTSGSGMTFFEFCVTANGNVTEFQSPQGVEHIREGSFEEGYGICDYTVAANYIEYFDYADGGASENWNDPILTQPHGRNTFPLTIARTTSDGVFTFKQSFTRTTGERMVKITMSVKNQSAITRNLNLFRYVDIDANNADGGDYHNEFEYDYQTAGGYNRQNYGLMLSSAPTNIFHQAIVQDNTGGISPCTPGSISAAPFLGDGSASMRYGLTLKPGQTKTVTVKYQRL